MDADPAPPLRCDLCHRPCSNRIPVEVVYKFTKTHMSRTLHMCRLHSYPTYFDECYCGDYMYGDYVRVNGKLWFWPTDSTGRPAPTSTIGATFSGWGLPADLGTFVDWWGPMTPRMQARRRAKPLLPLLGNAPNSPALIAALDHPDYPGRDWYNPRAPGSETWDAYLAQLTPEQREAVLDLYEASVNIDDRDTELDAHHLAEQE